jgi:hypothetical protein
MSNLELKSELQHPDTVKILARSLVSVALSLVAQAASSPDTFEVINAEDIVKK